MQRIINDMEAVLAELEQVAGFPRGKIFRSTEKASPKKTQNMNKFNYPTLSLLRPRVVCFKSQAGVGGC